MKRTILLFLACAGFLVAGGVMTEVSAVERKIVVMWVGNVPQAHGSYFGVSPETEGTGP